MHPIIPILDEQACAGRRPLRAQPPRLVGDAALLRQLIPVVQQAVQLPAGPIKADEPIDAWLRELRLEPGEAELLLAAELGCRGTLAAQLVFDVLRLRLPDTDIFVRVEADAARQALAG
jgi:hypothetical protein